MKELPSYPGAIKFMTPQPQSIAVAWNGYSMTVTRKYWALHYTHKRLCPDHWLDYSVRLNCAAWTEHRLATHEHHRLHCLYNYDSYMLNSVSERCKPIQPYQFNSCSVYSTLSRPTAQQYTIQQFIWNTVVHMYRCLSTILRAIFCSTSRMWMDASIWCIRWQTHNAHSRIFWGFIGTSCLK